MKNITLLPKAFHAPFYTILLLAVLSSHPLLADCLKATNQPEKNSFPMVVDRGEVASLYLSENDYAVVGICAEMLADDIERITGRRPAIKKTNKLSLISKKPAILAGTIGRSALIDELIASGQIDVSDIAGKWEAYLICTIRNKKTNQPLLLVVGSDRRGTAFGLTTLCRTIGVSPWYWWADVTPAPKSSLYLSNGRYVQSEPSVQYRGIFINDERFGGWARWAEQHFEQGTGKVGPKTYQKVFELLLRLRANYLWPAMHPGTQAFNADPENARLADEYAIVMGTSHCEQMLRNNEGEWKAVDEQARREGRVPPMGDFNYITNRETMQRYWEERIRTNGQYENTYTLGLRGIHDYPMEGANTTAERVRLMQQAINDQRDMLRRHIGKPIEDIPQVLCTYEEVLDAYHNGLQVPEDVTMLWSDDKQGYCRNLCNPEEMKRPGGAGIYYHLSYHGDPASWIWLSPLSPAFISTELTKAYQYGAQKIWVFNVGDIKPAEKEISFVMDLAWDIERWKPSEAHQYIYHWAEETFGSEIAGTIADMQAEYYRLQAAGKDSHVWFVEYSKEQITQRLAAWHAIAERATELESHVPERLRDAYFELVNYPISGAAMLNEYQLLARRSMVRATTGDYTNAADDAAQVEKRFKDLNRWTRHYNNEVQGGKWQDFFNWQPYHWFRSEKIEQPYATSAVIEEAKRSPSPQFLSVEGALTTEGLVFESNQTGEIPLWIKALSPIRNFSKAAEDNVFCHVTTENNNFDASATPINNVWHAPYVGPMWSCVGTIHVTEGRNTLRITDLKADARIDQIYMGLYPPFATEPRLRQPAQWYIAKRGNVKSIENLGYTNGVLVEPFDSPSYEPQDAPYVEYEIELQPTDSVIEIRTLPTLHIYEGRDARYAVQIGDLQPHVFSIHEGDFTAGWRLNVLRGYATRNIAIPAGCHGKQTLRIYLLDPGIVLQEICIIDN